MCALLRCGQLLDRQRGARNRRQRVADLAAREAQKGENEQAGDQSKRSFHIALEHVPGEIVVLYNINQRLLDVGSIDQLVLVLEIRAFE